MKQIITASLMVLFLFLFGCHKKAEEQIKVYGWNILTDNIYVALETLEAKDRYNINQLQLSSEICHELRDIKNQWNRNIVNNLTRKAHKIGIPEVLVWDQALYYSNYYPDRFKINGKINLDDREFWRWLKRDYEKMLVRIPEVDGIVLTLNETNTLVEDQYSEFLNTPESKLATFVDSLANFITNEKGMKLYLRYPVHSQSEVEKLISFLGLIHSHDIKFMVKGFSDNFFINQQFPEWIRRIPLSVIVDLDCAHEKEGQANIASIFPKFHLEQWKYYQNFPNVKGFSIRTDRLGETSIIDKPSEINLFAIYEANQDPAIETNSVILKYLYANYDSLAVPYLNKAFQLAPEIIRSSFYTLGINTTDHSQLNFNNKSSFIHKIFLDENEDPEMEIGHDVNKIFYYWSDVVNHLAPPEFKTTENLTTIPEVATNNWIQPEELMDTTYLNYILSEKEYAVNLANEAISEINMAKPYCSNSEQFNRIYHTFNRTLLTAELRKAYAQVYYSYRIWNRGEDFQNENLRSLIKDGIAELEGTSEIIKRYRRKGPDGQFKWAKDAQIAMKLVQKIKNSDILEPTK